MKIQFNLSSVLFLLLTFSLINSCRSGKNGNGNIEVPEVISGFTQGTISSEMPIFITFNKDVDIKDFEEKEIEYQDYFTIEPATNGKILWSGNRMMQFVPTGLKPNTEYTATIKLDQVFENYKEKEKEFTFTFSTVPLHFNVEFGELLAVSNDRYTLYGKIVANDSIPEADISKVIKLKYEISEVPSLEYNYIDNKTVSFTINNIKRTNEENSLHIFWDGNTLGSEDTGETQFEIPAIGDFKFMNFSYKSDASSIVSLTFSDQLNRTQDLGGIINTESIEEAPKIIIRNNIIDLEFNSYLEKDFEIKIGKKLLNNQNKELGKDVSVNILVNPPKPALKLIDNGIITPSEGNINFSFEAINLKAVDIEIRKIYANNIMQFLHYNSLNSEYIPAEISDIILQKKVSLAGQNEKIDMYKWRKYSIDISKLIKTDKGAIYNVKLAFRKSYTNYRCEDEHESAFESANVTEEPEFDPENPVSIWKDWYWYSGYEWEQESDPCYPLYYTARNFIQKNILASNLGITVKSLNSKSQMVIINDLLSASPIESAEIKCYTYSQQLIDTKTTDRNGLAIFDFKDKKPYFVIAKKGNDYAYVDLGEARSLSVSEFDVDGKKLIKGLDGYIYGERGVWRPGDSLFLNFILKRSNTDIPTDHPVMFELVDPMGRVHTKKTSTKAVGSIYNFNCSTNSNDPTGNWLAKVSIGNNVFTQRIKIETVKPNRLKIKVDFDHQDKLSLTENGKIDVKYLNGLTPSGSKAKIDIVLKKTDTKFKSYESYTFIDPASTFSGTEQTIFEGPLNENGKSDFSLNFAENMSYPGLLSAAFTVKAFETSGEYSTDYFKKIISPYDEYTGIRFPKNMWGSEGLKAGENGKVSIVVVDKNGKPLANRKVSALIYNAQWRWWWDDSDNYIANYLSDLSITPFKSINAVTNAVGIAELNIKIDDEGAYFLRVKNNKSGHSSGVLFYTGFFGSDSDETKDFASKLKFEVNKEEFVIGEKAKITIPAGKGNRIFIGIEDAESVKKTVWQSSDKDLFTYEFPVEKWMFPYVYLHVTVFRPIRNKNSDVPIRRYGIIPIKVNDKERKLEPVLTAPDMIKPNANYEIAVKEKSGRPMSYTIAVVDEGLLDLTRFKTPSPHDHFFAKFASAVSTWDVYNYIVQNEPTFYDRILSLGGDADLETSPDGKKATRFIPVVKNLGPFYLQKGKTARHKLKMDNYSGSVRVMVVAAGEKDYGNAEKAIPVKSELMMLLTAPRKLSTGEIFEMPVTIFATENNIKNVSITCSPNSLVELDGVSNISVNFDKPGEKMAYLRLKAKNKEGAGSIEVKASLGKYIANQKINLNIENPNPFVRNVSSKTINSGQSLKFNIDPIGTQGTNSGMLEFSILPKLELESKIQYLLHYPYGCIEQTTSTAFPLVNLKNIMEMSTERTDKVNQIIIAAVNRLKSFQIKSGGFSYWPGGYEVDPWGTIYATHFLLEARAHGYNTTPVLDNGLNYLNKYTNSKLQDNNDYYITQRAYALMVLAKAGKPNRSSMNYLYNLSKLPTQARWFLALAYSYAGNKDVALKLYNKAANQISDYTDVYYTYGSSLRDYSVLLMLTQSLNKTESANTLAKDIINRFNKSWFSTHETAYTLIALSDFIGKSARGLDFSVTKGNETKAIKSQKGIFTMQVKEIDFRNIKVINKNTNSPLFVNIVSTGKALQKEGSDDNANLAMSIQYVDKHGNNINTAKLKMGTEFKALVNVKSTTAMKDYRNLVINQVFPSGWEILNWRIADENSTNTAITYQDIRDDRVYSFINLSGNSTIEIPLIASYPGKYYLPVQFAESMYDKTIYNRKKGGWVEVER